MGRLSAWLLLLLLLVGGCRTGCGGAPEPGGRSDGRAAAEDGADVADVAPAPSRPWARAFGGPGDDEALAVAVGADHSVVVAGRIVGPAELGQLRLGGQGGSDAIVAAFDRAGEVRWVRTLGGPGEDLASGVAVRADGGVVAVGQFEGVTDLDPDPGAELRAESAGGSDVFVIELDPEGRLRWARTVGGPGTDEAHAVAVGGESGDGRVVVAGAFGGGADLDPGEGVDRRAGAGDVDAFVIGLSAEGSRLWSFAFGGPGADVAHAVATAQGGGVAVAGWFSETVVFDPSAEGGEIAEPRPSRGFTDLFAASVGAAGDLRWVWTGGGPLVDQAQAVAVEPDGALWVTGFFVDALSIQVAGGVIELRSAGRSDALVLRLDPAGAPIWATAIGGESADYGYGVACAPTGEALVTGRFGGVVDLDGEGPGAGEGAGVGAELSAAGPADAFVVRLGVSGAPTWSRGLGGVGVDRGLGVALGPDGGVFVAGAFEETADVLGAFTPAALPTPGGALRSLGATDGYVVRLPP